MQVDELLLGSEKALAQVYPVLRSRVQDMIRQAWASGLYFGAFMGLRTYAEQDALYAKGRTAPGPQVTKARGGESWHNFGLAVDMVEDGDPNRAGIQWSWDSNADYLRLGAFAKSCNLEWGGWWKSFKDYPHVELTLGLQLGQARYLYLQGGIQEVWKEIDERLKDAAQVSG